MYFGVHALGLFVAVAGRHRYVGSRAFFGFSIFEPACDGGYRRDCADAASGCRGVNGGAVVSAGVANEGIVNRRLLSLIPPCYTEAICFNIMAIT